MLVTRLSIRYTRLWINNKIHLYSQLADWIINAKFPVLISQYPRFSLVLLSLLLTLTLPAQGAPIEQAEKLNDRPKIGLVLSGGGARGASHVGVLKVLEQLRIPVDIITGTSMGAIAGGLYAYGYTPQELEVILNETDWDDIFIDKPPRKQRSYRRKQDDFNYLMKLEAGIKNGRIVIPTGLIQGQKLDLLLKSLLQSAPRDFDLLPIPFRAIASNIETGQAEIMGYGNIVTAMRASMSIPGVFTPVKWNGKLLVDGGFSNNIPIKLARELGADILIVVDLSGELRQRESLSSPLSILNQTLGFLIQNNTQDQLDNLDPMDILIQPDMGNFSSTDFWRSVEMVELGVKAANTKTPQLANLSVPVREYKIYQTMRRRTIIDAPLVDNIIINNNSTLSDNVIKSFLTIRSGEIFNRKILERDIADIYGLNIFERVTYELINEGDQTTIIITVVKKDWGPNYLRFGMNLEGNFQGSSHYNFGSSLTVTPLNRLGGEWRSEFQLGSDQKLSTEFYQPLDSRLRYYIRPGLEYESTHVQQYESDKQVSDNVFSTFTATLNVGRNLGNWGAVELGLGTGTRKMTQRIGEQANTTSSYKTGGWYAIFTHDQLDSLNFPKNGQLSNFNWYKNSKELGAENDIELLGGIGAVARTWKNNTLLVWGELNANVTNDNSETNTAVFGGFYNLSGYRRFEPDISGRYSGIVRFIFFRLLNSKKSTFKIPVYIGCSLESGGAWNNSKDFSTASFITAGSVSISFDTMLGPIYIARGYAEGGKTANYFFLGRTFVF